MSEKKKLLTTDDVEDLYSIDKQSQKIYREKHGMPFMKVGKRIRYKTSDLDAWVDANTKSGDASEEHN